MPLGPPSAPKRGNRTPLIIGIAIGVALLLCCGIGGIAFFLSRGDNTGSNSADPPTGNTTTRATPHPSATSSKDEVQGDLARYKTGDCLTIDSANNVKPAKCSTPGAYKVLRRKDGTLLESACDGTDATDYLTNDQLGTTRDFVLCIVKVS
jgi:hypothetical protein